MVNLEVIAGAETQMRDYFSVRTRRETGDLEWSFDELKELIISIYKRFEGQGYFAEAFGQYCVDRGPTVGEMGSNIDLFFRQRLRKRDLWPVEDHMGEYSQHDLFSVIELLHDYVSKPQSCWYHSWDGCGNHYSEFDRHVGRTEFRTEINSALKDCEGQKYELSSEGEILQIPDSGLDQLVEEPLEYYEPETVEKRVEAAIHKFRRYSASPEDRKDAIRTLADVLES